MNSRDVTLFAASPERVWAVLADWQRYPEWMPDVAWVRPMGPEREVGLRLLVKTRVLGVPLANDVMVIRAWEPPRRLAIEHSGTVHGPAEWLLEPVEQGTRFTWSETVRMPPPILGDLALRLYWPWQRRMFRRSMENLRLLVEPPG